MALKGRSILRVFPATKRIIRKYPMACVLLIISLSLLCQASAPSEQSNSQASAPSNPMRRMIDYIGSLLYFFSSSEEPHANLPNTLSNAKYQGDIKVADLKSYQMTNHIGTLGSWLSTGWMAYYKDKTLLELSLPATYHSLLFDGLPEGYEALGQTQSLNTLTQLRDGIRMFHTGIWSSTNSNAVTWHAAVPWRSQSDMKMLQETDLSKNSSKADVQRALNVHSKTDLQQSLFLPVLKFMRENLDDVIIVNIDSVNGHLVTDKNYLDESFDLATYFTKYLPHEKIEKFVESFVTESAGSMNSPNFMKQYAIPGPQYIKGQSNNLNEYYLNPRGAKSAIEKTFSLKDLSVLLKWIDDHWGQLLPRHEDVFQVNRSTNQKEWVLPIQESYRFPREFRNWQKSKGYAVMNSSISSLLRQRIRIILLVDHPFVAWFLTTYSRNRILVLYKGDHIYDVSYKSEVQYMPCAMPHLTYNGNILSESTTLVVSDCQSACAKMPGKACKGFTWSPSDSTKQFNDKGKCTLFGSIDSTTLSFGAVSQTMQDGIKFNTGKWSPQQIYKDMRYALMPEKLNPKETLCPEKNSLDEKDLETSNFNIDSPSVNFDNLRLSLLASNAADSLHAKAYDVDKKLIQLSVYPNEPYYTPDVSKPFISFNQSLQRVLNGEYATLVTFILRLNWRYKKTMFLAPPEMVSQYKKGLKPVNAILVPKYETLRSKIPSLFHANHFELTMALNPSPEKQTKQRATTAYYWAAVPTTVELEEPVTKSHSVWPFFWYLVLLTVGMACFLLLCLSIHWADMEAIGKVYVPYKSGDKYADTLPAASRIGVSCELGQVTQSQVTNGSLFLQNKI